MGIWRTLSWSDYYELLRDFALGLASVRSAGDWYFSEQWLQDLKARVRQRLHERGELTRSYRARLAELRPVARPGASFNQRSDVALSMQMLVESRIMSFLREIAEPAPSLVLSGGVALNCSINATVAGWCGDRGTTLAIPPPPRAFGPRRSAIRFATTGR